MDAAPPPDKWNLIYLTLIFHGIGTVMAWNIVITAKDYFVKFKLVDTAYAQNFLAYVGWAAQIPNLLFNWVNVFVNLGGRLTPRIIVSIIVMLFIFTLIIGLAIIDTSECPETFFWLTMSLVFILKAFSAIYQNSIFGIAAQLPPRYMGAYVMGTNLSGIVVVFLSWISSFFKSQRAAAIFYFLCGMFILFICLNTYIALQLNKFYRYYRGDVNEAVTAPGTSPGQSTKVPYGLIFWQTRVQLYNVFINFFVTLSMYPSVLSDIHPVKEGFLGDNFMLITSFLTISVTAMIGTITASIFLIPTKKYLIVFATSRVVFIPLLLLCNYQVPGRTLPVLIKNDWVFWVIGALFGWSSGHGSCLAMMYVAGDVAPELARNAGMIGAAVFMTGVFMGVVATRLAPIIVSF